MNRNMGNTDRALRTILGVGAVAGSGVLGFGTGWGIVLLVVAAVMLLTSAIGYCPLYSLFGIDTTCSTSATTDKHHTFHLHRTA